MNFPRLLVPLLLLSSLLRASDLSREGLQLSARYDAMDVEHHWLAGVHVAWLTGCPDTGRPAKTHCSAFAAAACERLGIYLLRPPAHSQMGLANAQAAWLRGDGRRKGWTRVEDPFLAQQQANRGQVVVAVLESPDPGHPGHIALVRPSPKSDGAIRTEGPQIIQAGQDNLNSASLREGFRHHRGAWISAGHYSVCFFANTKLPLEIALRHPRPRSEHQR